MPSLARSLILEDGSLFHVTWQCHNQDWLLKSRWAKQLYYDLLLKYKNRYQVEIYSYCFMDNHPHLAGRFSSLGFFSDFFRTVNSAFARLYNREVKRRGQVVMDRFKSPRIQTETHLLRVMTYIDLNPKRAGKVPHPRENQFSSFGHYAYGRNDPLITTAPAYLELAITPQGRQEAYRALVGEILKSDWRQKKPYSSSHFIGNPQWVLEKTKDLREAQKEKWGLWRKKFKERFSMAA